MTVRGGSAVALDTSALMAFLLDEGSAEGVAEVLASASGLVVSAGTMAEVLIVAERRGIGAEMSRLLSDLGVEVEPVTAAVARRVAEAYGRWGRGVDPAGLNFGDCFAYALAQERGLPLLYVGDDFSRTDLPAALASRAER